MGKVFLSYSRADSLDFARELHRRFVRDGIDCFFDEESIEWGAHFVLSLEKGLDECEHFVAVLSPGFVNSQWTDVERTSIMLEDPANLKGKILPLLYRPCEAPGFLKALQYLNVTTTDQFDTHYSKICRTLGGTLQPDTLDVDFNATMLPRPAPLPSRHRMPYPSLGSRFSGRVRPLLDLHQLLLQSDGIAVVEGIGVVVGTGGLGKTQLAIEYVHRFGNHYVGGVFWVNTDQPYINVIQELARYAGVELDDRLSEPQQAEMLWRGLVQYPGVMLIVYDNFPDDIPFQPWLPVNTTQIKTLVTTRRQDLAQPKITLPFMDKHESLMMLNSRERQFDQEILPLIDALGGLPLALELVCHYLNHRRTLTVEQLLEEMAAIGDIAVLDEFTKMYSDELPSGHEKAVGATFQISWQQVSSTAQSVLCVMACWAPTPVPRLLIGLAFNSQPNSAFNDPIDNAIEELVRFSLVELDEDHDPYLHRLLRGFVRIVVDLAENKKTALSALTKEFERASDASDTKAINELEKVLPHGQSVLDEALGDMGQLIEIAGYLAWHQENRGRFQLARQSRTWALASAEQHYEPGHPAIATSQSNLGSVLQDLGDYGEARDLLRKALASDELHYKPGHPAIATSQSNLGWVLQDLGVYDEAKDLLRKALASAEQHYEPGGPTIAIHQSSLALVLQDLGDYDEAKDLLRKALASDELHYESGHPAIARSQSNLGSVLKDLGDYDEAKDLLRKALASAEQHYEPGHPTISIRQSNLALVLQDLDDYGEAKDLLRKALASTEQHYEPGHPAIAKCQSSLGSVLQDLDDCDEAKDLLRKALASVEQHYKPGHPAIATSQSNLGSVLQDLGDYGEARDLLRKALASTEQHYKPGHPAIATSQSNLALVLKDLGDYDGAKDLLRKALASTEQHYELGHPTIAVLRSNLEGIPK